MALPPLSCRVHRLNRYRVLLLSGLFLQLFSAAIPAQESVLQDDVLTLPTVVFNDRFYHAEFQLTSIGESVFIDLIAAEERTVANTIGGSYFDGENLGVSHIALDGQSFNARFELQQNFRFELQSVGLNDAGISSNRLGLDQQPVWLRVAGDAIDVGIGADGSQWVLGLDPRGGGNGIYRRINDTWQRVDGGAVRIDVDPSGNPWIINESHQIYRRINDQWQRLPGDARDVGIGANGAVWVAAGGGIFHWNGLDWDRVSGSAVRIDVDPAGNPWVIDHTDDIYELVDGRWLRRPGAARDIGIGADGSVWIIGTREGDGGHGIYRWNGQNWSPVTGSGRQVSVGPDGLPWVASSGGEIYRAR